MVPDLALAEGDRGKYVTRATAAVSYALAVSSGGRKAHVDWERQFIWDAEHSRSVMERDFKFLDAIYLFRHSNDAEVEIAKPLV